MRSDEFPLYKSCVRQNEADIQPKISRSPFETHHTRIPVK